MKTTILITIMVGVFWGISVAYSMKIPETIYLDSLSKIYDKVQFSHLYHSEIVGECSFCHHHSRKNVTPPCKDCHEITTVYKYKGKERITGIGLKGAYHLQCINCHKEGESGPVGCTDCHAKK